ncbi:MAG: hypothetical protein HC880_06945 [Bacteroidia bacterium]|nr:hypothetical protein [Bacteroidia bacterium]
MIDWSHVYQRLMSDFKSGRLIPHVAILGGAMVVGIVVGIYFDYNLNLMFIIWFMGALVDLLIYRQELLHIFTKKKPCVINGIILKKVKKLVTEKQEEYDEFYFDILVNEAFVIDKQGRNEKNYYEKEGEQRVGVPESMFLSLKAGQEVSLVCEPDDYVWGIVRDDEVINIEE